MGFVKRRGKRWYAIVTDRTTKKKQWLRLPLSIEKRNDALKAMLHLEDEEERRFLNLPNASSAESTKKWMQVAAEVLAEVEQDFEPRWYDCCRLYVKRFLAVQGDCFLDEVTKEQCRAYLQERKESGKHSQSTLRREMMFIGRVFRRAVEDELLEKNPWEGISLPKEPKGEPHYLQVEDVGNLLEAAPTDRRFRYLLLVYTGARKSEALRLKWKDVDLPEGTLRIRNSQKGGGQKHVYRVVPIAPDLHGALEERQGEPEENILETEHNWTRDLRLDLKSAGLAHCRIHDLRHTYGSWLAQRGVSLHKIRDLMGHASVTTTERYAYLAPGRNDAVLEALGRIGSDLVAENENKEVSQ